jgi:hypothetical protein
MTDSERLDLLVQEFRELRKEMQSYGPVLARLDERSKNLDKRVDKVERKSAGLGATAGGAAGGFVAGFINFFGGSG